MSLSQACSSTRSSRLNKAGHDSAGVATVESGLLTRRRARTNCVILELGSRREPLRAPSASAAHGRPSEGNAHPPATDRLAVVHNGISRISASCAELEQKSAKVGSDTVPHLIRVPGRQRRCRRETLPTAPADRSLRAGALRRRCRQPLGRIKELELTHPRYQNTFSVPRGVSSKDIKDNRVFWV